MWSMQALVSVASRFLETLPECDADTRENIAYHMAFAHEEVAAASLRWVRSGCRGLILDHEHAAGVHASWSSLLESADPLGARLSHAADKALVLTSSSGLHDLLPGFLGVLLSGRWLTILDFILCRMAGIWRQLGGTTTPRPRATWS